MEDININSLEEIVMVEMPCFCSNQEKVESFFGGKQNFYKILQEEHSNLPFYFHINDPLRPPLIGKRYNTQGLLISLKKSKNGEITYKNIGKVTSSYKFKSPPEYQVNIFINYHLYYCIILYYYIIYYIILNFIVIIL